MIPRRLLVVLLAVCGDPATARTLDVGPGRTYASPSDAAAAAADGDAVTITPGTYFDCAIWRANGLTIAGTGPDVLMTDKACAGKAAFVIQGDGVTIRGLSFMRVRVPDGNGAGIRSEARDLTVEDSRFVDNQVAILAGNQGGSLRISGCNFTANGAGTREQPIQAVLAGALGLLRIAHSVFRDGRRGGYVESSALRTELIGNLLSEGGGMTGPLVSVNGGALVLDANTVDLAAGAADRPGAVLIYGDAEAVTVRGNTLIEPVGSVPLLRDWGGAGATEDSNTVPANALAVSESGATYHRLRARFASLRTAARGLAGLARHEAAELVRGLKLIP